MGLADALSKISGSLITEHGATLVVKKRTPGAYNVDTSEVVVAETSTSCNGVVESYAVSLVDGTRIQSGDKKVLIAASALATAPVPGDVITFAGSDWSVVNVDTTYYKDVAVTYSIQVRK